MKKIKLIFLALSLLGLLPSTSAWARGGGHGGGGGHFRGGFGGGWGHGGGGHPGGMHFGGGQHFGGGAGYYRGGGVGVYHGGGFGYYRGPRGFYRGYGYGLGYGFGGLALGLGLGYGMGYGMGGFGFGSGSPYSYPPAGAAQGAPPVYIQRQDMPQQNNTQMPAQPNYWYYCEAPAGYYPGVQNCPGGWKLVSPQPAQ